MSRPKQKMSFREMVRFMAQALDDIYNESEEARQAVLKHYGALHWPYNAKFRSFLRKRKKGAKP